MMRLPAIQISCERESSVLAFLLIEIGVQFFKYVDPFLTTLQNLLPMRFDLDVVSGQCKATRMDS